MAKTDTLAAARLALLERLGVSSQKFQLRRTEEPLEGGLVAFLRWGARGGADVMVAFLRVLQMDQATLIQERSEEELQGLLQVMVRASNPAPYTVSVPTTKPEYSTQGRDPCRLQGDAVDDHQGRSPTPLLPHHPGAGPGHAQRNQG